MAIKLDQITPEYISGRADSLSAAAGDRNDRMERYLRMYRLDPYESSAGPSEFRLSLPLAHNAVEKIRAMLVTRPPVITVPAMSAKREDESAAQRVERFLYGAAHCGNLQRSIQDAEFYACCMGAGLIKTTYFPYGADDEFPLVFSAPDPRTCYWKQNATKTRITELVHMWERPRREIEEEWDIELPRDQSFQEAKREAEWLDEKVDYIEYWSEQIVTIEDEDEDEPVLSLVSDLADQAMIDMARAAAAMPLADGGELPETPLDGEPGVVIAAGPIADGTPDEFVPEPKTERKKRRVRQVVHSVIVRGVKTSQEKGGIYEVKTPVVMTGYTRIPFAKWSGVATPQSGGDADLSVLYPLSNGDGGDKAMGILAAYNALASIQLQTAIDSPNAMTVVLNPEKGNPPIDTSAGAVNEISAEDIRRLPPDNASQTVAALLPMLSGQLDESSIPEILKGKYHNISGAAISGMSSVFEMMVGFKQVERQRALEDLLLLVLDLARQYADGDGWTVYGNDRGGKFFNQAFKSEDAEGVYRVQVKLSAAMPRDYMTELNMAAGFVRQDLMSMESWIDMQQKLTGSGADTPDNEKARILRDKMLFRSPYAEVLAGAEAEKLMAEWASQGLISPEAIQRAKAMAQQPPAGPPQEGGPPGGGMVPTVAQPPAPAGMGMMQ